MADAFDAAWDLTKYKFDSRGNPNRLMNEAGRMRTGGNLPGPKNLDEFLSDEAHTKDYNREVHDHNVGQGMRQMDKLSAVQDIIMDYMEARGAKSAEETLREIMSLGIFTTGSPNPIYQGNLEEPAFRPYRG